MQGGRRRRRRAASGSCLRKRRSGSSRGASDARVGLLRNPVLGLGVVIEHAASRTPYGSRIVRSSVKVDQITETLNASLP
jgi:hypothetical protein